MQFISDLHLEFFNKPLYEQLLKNILDAKGNNKFIALLGDIGDPMMQKYNFYEQLISDLSGEYESVFVVAGNHEYYSGYPMNEIDDRIEEICDKPNVYFLNNRTVNLVNRDQSIAIVGSTLWSHIPEENKMHVKQRINDYRQIYTIESDIFTPETSNKLHKEAVEFIEQELEKHKNAIVLTHHSPLIKGTSAPLYEKNRINCAFSTDLDRIIKHPVKAWCFGHTHWQTNIVHNGIPVMSNPLGYRNELLRNGQKINFGMCINLRKLIHK